MGLWTAENATALNLLKRILVRETVLSVVLSYINILQIDLSPLQTINALIIEENTG